ncbi:MAG: haloacid dehalogenase [Sulfurimonas sp. RIFCSPHIGHO2_12_FULL_36_9]|uniref:HAD family hydrolase n=1 Tax=Sulfurimonas sp. RIFCSPLOWO2_12_36_12 TaxID=1802253 RepID=UPI0008C55C30|nr:HAD family hydrolase [Sulfurimonas sp. RIFCSPLOWO2_12_36_12]OHD96375.1 MAG: haloacid dehalogenase [Sulfurimonas sp. RIFCSPHIGHO2_12_FULL_36_9]OHD97535.1 MAG: haloacid dehalogenase [Sulfurimonas sp. RIFCSPLOWO2_02_FULL_36_28]OHE02468.1 MAG: haloacid dehalogenase [Sulfurimonas sp. RIFCSPLOWO2_12_36_12]
MNLALFDFDGTLTTKDSLDEFLKESGGKKKYMLNMFKFLPYFALWQLRVMPNGVAKEHLFRIFFKGMDENIFKEKARDFSLNKLDLIINQERVKLLKKHQENGDRVVIVSASMKCWLQPWCDKNSIELLSTQLEFKNGAFSGKFLTPNCHGKEKENRIKEHLNIKDYETIYAYGDSSGDKEMLLLAHKRVRY